MIRRQPTVILSIGLCLLTAAKAQTPVPLPTGKTITPRGKHTPVGSFPCNMALVRSGKYALVTNAGFRQALTVVHVQTGEVASRIEFSKSRNGVKEGLYYGLAVRPGAQYDEIWVSRGSEERVTLFTVDEGGMLREADQSIPIRRPGGSSAPREVAAGLALNSDGSRLYVAGNNTSRATAFRGTLNILDTTQRQTIATVEVPGFPYDVIALTKGRLADRKVYVSSERDGVVAVIDPSDARLIRTIRTGANPTTMALDHEQKRLFVSNSGSDTISIIDTERDRIVETILVRPEDLRGLPGATPLGLALGPDERRLYVALADMNAIGVVDLQRRGLIGFIPVGWYPTSLSLSHDGSQILVANGKGTTVQNPNGTPAGPGGAWGQYIPNIIEGAVSSFATPADSALEGETLRTLANNRIAEARRTEFRNPGIKHVFYIIKENRTYDQVFGDIPSGNGDPSLCLFPRDVTPNQHALAERFGLFDNFHCCAEVSADGWNWSVSGMANEYTVRNSLYSYSGRGRAYDYEGLNNGSPVDLMGLRDVAASPGGYIWDLCARKGVSFRNYGFYVQEYGEEDRDKKGSIVARPNTAVKRALIRATDESFLQYDLAYADSDAWVTYQCPAPNQKRAFGVRRATSRYAEWKAEFDEFVRNRNLPRFNMIRLPRDHTQGTTVGVSSPRAMVADNDYAVGQIVEAISASPYWTKSAVFIVEDDAQAGHDHVDAHRSVALVISPYSRRSAVDSRFYNTDSALRTMELILGLPPLCQYDAVAPPFDCFTRRPENAEPYTAILPAREIIAEVNGRTAFKADLSATLNFADADAAPDAILNHILWHAIKGPDVAEPPSRFGLRVAGDHDDD